MKTLRLLLFGCVLLVKTAWADKCPSNFDQRFSGKLKEVNPQRPLFKLLKNDVRDGYEPGQEITLSLHSLVASRPMNGFLVTAKSIDGRCGDGVMVAQRSTARTHPRCPNALESASMVEWQAEATFGFRAPECGCVMIKATVVAAMHNVAYVDAGGVFEGPLTMTLCPWPQAETAPVKPLKEVVKQAVEYKTKSELPKVAEIVEDDTDIIDRPTFAELTEEEVDLEDDVDDLAGDLDDDLPDVDDDDEEFIDDDDDDDFNDEEEYDIDDDEDYEIDDDEEEDDAAEVIVIKINDDRDSADLDDISSEEVDTDESLESSEESYESSEEIGGRPWRRRQPGRQRRPGRNGKWTPRRRPHGRNGNKAPIRKPTGPRTPPRRRRPVSNKREHPKSPLFSRVNGRLSQLGGKPAIDIHQKLHPAFQRLLNGRRNPLGLVRHHLMGPNNYLIDRLCTTLEKVLDETKGSENLNSLPFQMPHFFGCPNTTALNSPTFHKRGPPGFQQEQAKRRMGEFDSDEIRKRWGETKQHTKMCCGKTGEARYACLRRQRMDVVCAPDFRVPLCASPSTVLVRWKIAEARDTCCVMHGIERYDCFNRTTHPIAGHPVLNHGSKAELHVEEELTKKPVVVTPTIPFNKDLTEEPAIPSTVEAVESDKAPTDGWVEAIEDKDDSLESDETDWLEDAFDEEKGEISNRDIETYLAKQSNGTTAAKPHVEEELEATPDDTDEEREMKEDFIEDIAKPVWQRSGLLDRIRNLGGEVADILGDVDPIDEIDTDGEELPYDEDLEDDNYELDELEDAINEQERQERRPGHMRPRRKLSPKKCCWAGRRVAQEVTPKQRWPTCVAKSKTIGHRLHGLMRRKCKVVFRRCCIRAKNVDDVRPVNKGSIVNVPKNVRDQVLKHIKQEWKH